ncbi:MAG TPA: TetR/AcrR family transcriptional regulator [Stellaceae bacterium]|jgi:AcrR family transcriptional regulator|nr:TetR/AcrR family transcriptional regulator [Stellaceae bacterium]
MASSGKRIARKDRERAILDIATQYFAEVGFQGQMRELARRIGVSPALLFKYFSTKEALVDRVCEEIYLQRWKPAWEEMLDDRELSLRDRLIRFYDDYVATALDSEWIRIFMYGSLAGNSFNRYYLSRISTRIIPRICKALREEAHVAAEGDYTPGEIQLAWGLHGSVLYYLIERNIYGSSQEDPALVVRARVASFLDGAPASMESLGPGTVTGPGDAAEAEDAALNERMGGIFTMLRDRGD